MTEGDEQTARTLLESLGLDGTLISLEPIEEGFSSDRKFHAITGHGAEYLLRLSGPETEEAKRFEFDCVSKLGAAGILCAEAIRVGVAELIVAFRTKKVAPVPDLAFSWSQAEPEPEPAGLLHIANKQEKVCYGLYSYIPGDCAWDVLPGMTPADQRNVGMQSGDELRRMHEALTPPAPVNEYRIRFAKFHKHLGMVADAGVTIPGQEPAIRYVEEHLHLLKDRPTTFRHGDFHPANLIVQGSALVGVIDFNRCDWGDPFDDFYKTSYFGAPLSPDWARGLIAGYFQGDPPPEFWPLYNLFVGATLSSDVAWAIQLFPDRLQESLDRVQRILATHDFQFGGAPTWASSW